MDFARGHGSTALERPVAVLSGSWAGAIVHVSGRPEVAPTDDMKAYGVSEAALTYLVRGLDLELRPSGIQVNAVTPQSRPPRACSTKKDSRRPTPTRG
ncbi:SDR family NAD(P)-dependent oxidoreductase [Streptomyces sp. LN704]|uniref:SDR family NAD(P)-dependent oxidoreductase n=1 Tax=unclassified Streptomyces TaxID=2593676 RepID=UPI003713164E